MIDRLAQLLREHDRLFVMICRDATPTDVELMAQAGYHVVWLDLEHSPQPISDAVRLGRTVSHLGMVPLVRVPEMSRSHVQVLLDAGIEIIALPDVKNALEASELVQLGKYPPVGRRGFSSTTAVTGFTVGIDPEATLRQVNDATRLMVLVESDEGYEALDAILEVEGLDMVAIGAGDWGVSVGLFGDEARTYLAPKIDRIVRSASRAGKIVPVFASSPEEMTHYYDLGARLFVVGVDITMKRRALTESIARLQVAKPK